MSRPGIRFKEPTAKQSGSKVSHMPPFPLSQAQENTATKCKYVIGSQIYVGYLENGEIKIKDLKGIDDIQRMGYFGTRGRNTAIIQETQTLNRAPFRETKDDAGEIDAQESYDITQFQERHRNLASGSILISLPTRKESTSSSPDEDLYLMLEEAYFLAYALGCLVVMKNGQPLDLLQLWEECCSLTGGCRFPMIYAAYHYFRSKGWVIRSGLKFGSDYLLYKDGPDFYHASYSVIVKCSNDERMETWRDLIAFNRVTESVGKDVLLCYVITPPSIRSEDLKSPECITKFQIQEVISQRWLASEERSQDNPDS